MVGYSGGTSLVYAGACVRGFFDRLGGCYKLAQATGGGWGRHPAYALGPPGVGVGPRIGRPSEVGR
jgi:hypothetical protein